jgi:uncharacterized protein YdeI (YjbR/CyaY-like superfamily)
MKDVFTIYFTDRSHWRQWLDENHDSAKEVWLVFYHKKSGKPSMAYNDAVEEALCFGWIDSIIKKLDEERYMQKFTPRRADSKWSESNLKRVERLISDGLMTEAGMALIVSLDSLRKRISEPSRFATELPPELKRHLYKNRKAWASFQKLPPSHKKQYVGWVTSAKRNETKISRLKEAMHYLERQEKLPLK